MMGPLRCQEHEFWGHHFNVGLKTTQLVKLFQAGCIGWAPGRIAAGAAATYLLYKACVGGRNYIGRRNWRGLGLYLVQAPYRFFLLSLTAGFLGPKTYARM
jgi:hypothetical protein